MAFTAFAELATSPVLDISQASTTAVREAMISAANLNALIETVFPLGDFGIAYPGNPALRAASMHVQPYQGDKEKITAPSSSNLDISVINTVQYYRVRITYETMQATQGDDPQLLLSHRWSIGGEYLTVESKGLEWSDGGLVDDDVKAGILIPTIEHQITWARVPSPPFSVIRDRLGSVNNASLTFNTGIIFPETLLFLGAELRRDILTNGALAWEVGYHFSERRVPLATDLEPGDNGNKVGGVASGDDMVVGGWNHVFRSEDEDSARLEGKVGFYRLRLKSDESPINRLKPFGNLFVQGS